MSRFRKNKDASKAEHRNAAYAANGEDVIGSN